MANAPSAAMPAVKKTSTKKKKKQKLSPTDAMQTPAEQLWSAKKRGLLSFEAIPPVVSDEPAMPVGGVGVAPGYKGAAAFWAYIRHDKVTARLRAEGFKAAPPGAPHPWFLILAPGVVTPANKALCRALTAEQRKRIAVNRASALERLKRVAF